MRQTSIQRRLIAAVVISQLLLAIGIVSVAVYFTRRQLRNAFDAGLHGRAMSIAALVRYSEDEHPKLIFEGDLVPPPLEKQHPDLYQVIADNGRVLARSPNWPHDLQAISKKDRQHADFTVEGVRYRAVRLENVPVLDREGDAPSTDVLTVTYAAPTDEMTRAIARAGIYIAAGSGLLLLMTVGIAVLGLRRGLRPLAELATSAALINTSNWKLNPSEAGVEHDGTGSPHPSDDRHAGRTASRVYSATRIPSQCRSRTEDAGCDPEVHVAIAAAATAQPPTSIVPDWSRRLTTWRASNN